MKKAIWLGSVLALLGTASTALAADTVVMTVKAAKQGDFKGGTGQKGKDVMLCTGFESQLLVPRDNATGKASGRLQVDAIKCVRRVDRASPLFINALLSNEVLTDVTFSFSHASPGAAGGADTLGYTIALKNATVAGVRQFLDPAGLAQEEVSISYQQATASVQGGATAEIKR